MEEEKEILRYGLGGRYKMMDLDARMDEAVAFISKNHRQIIDDWCKAYLAQLYEEGIDLKPGCFILVEQVDLVLENGKLGKKYWFKRRDENDRP